MRIHHLTPADWAKAIGIGVVVAALTAIIMLIAERAGISPLPAPLGLAFANALTGMDLPLPIGMLFHVLWVTLFAAVYVVLFRDALTFMHAFWLAVALWLLVLVFFFPFVGWGLLGLAVTPRLAIASAVPHLLFAVFLWSLCRWSFGVPSRPYGAAGAPH